MGLANWFSSFHSNLQVRNQATISTRYRSITLRLNIDFWGTNSETSHSLYVGSYGRNTATDGFSDLDMIFDLPSDLYFRYDEYTTNGQSALLQHVRNSIRQTYPTTDIGADGQVIEVRFTSPPTFEVVPAFSLENGSYVYPDTNSGGTWQTTNPRPEIQALRTRNQECNGNLIRLCRMIRAWKSKWQVPMGGLLIDTLAWQFLGSWEYRDKSYIYYDWMCRDFFDYMANQDTSQTYWRAPGSMQYVYSRENFRSKARACHTLSIAAIDHESASPKREWSAKQKWREIFGARFPS